MSLPVSLTSDWVRIAVAGDFVLVQNSAIYPLRLSVASSQPIDESDGIELSYLAIQEFQPLAEDLYARGSRADFCSVTLLELAAVASGGGGGGGGGGVVMTNYAKESGGKLESIDAKTPALSGGKVPVVLAGVAQDASVTDLGTKLDTNHAVTHADLEAIEAALEVIRTTLGAPAQAGGSVALTNQIAGYALDATMKEIQGILAGTLKTAAQAGEVHLGEIGGSSVVAVGSFTRPANTTAYAQNQAVQSSPAAAVGLTVARKAAGTGRATRLRLTKSTATLQNASFRVHLFKAAPTTLAADGTAFAGNSGALTHIGAFPITMTLAFADGAKGYGTVDIGAYVTFDAAGGDTKLYALVEAMGAYVPGSAELFTIALEADRD